MKFESGAIVRFTYNAPKEEAEVVTDRFKEVFILNGDQGGLIHALDLKRLSPADREVLELIMDPESKGKVHRIPIVNDILKRMDPLIEIKNPVSFYAKFVRPFLHSKDAYRTYFPNRMANATVIEKSSVQGQVIDPKPLLHAISPTQPPAGQSELGPAPPKAQKGVFKAPAPIAKPKIQRPKKGRTV